MGWVYGAGKQDGSGPRVSRTCVEVTAENKHDIDLFRDVPLRHNAVPLSLLYPMGDPLVDRRRSQSLALIREELVHMRRHTLLEAAADVLVECIRMLSAKRKHIKSVGPHPGLSYLRRWR